MPLLGNPVRFLARHAAQLEQVRQILVANALPLLDRPIQQRLREAGLVAFVVAPAAVAVHVDHDVALELLAKVQRQVNHLGHGLGIFAIDVEDGNLQHLGHVGGVRRRAAFFGRRW